MTSLDSFLWFYVLPCVICILFSWARQIFYGETNLSFEYICTYLPILNFIVAVIILMVAVGCVGIAIVELPNTIKGLKK